METKNLYLYLFKISNKAILFGHQDDLISGVNWKNKSDSSDIKRMTGKFPALYGWDIGKLEINNKLNFEGVSLTRIAKGIETAYNRGGINTVSWLCHNPVNPSETAKSKTDSTIKKLFENPTNLDRYNLWLSKIAIYIRNLKGNDGKTVPIILRLFHENTGSWFWWGKNHCTPEEYIKLFRYTVDYLRIQENLNNVLFAYCTDKFSTKEQFLERFPGDNYVDIIGADIYDNKNGHSDFIPKSKNMLAIMKAIGNEKNKPYAIMETGFKNMPIHDWWSKTLLPVIQSSGISYVMIWRNSNSNSFWGSYPGHDSEGDFLNFSKNKRIYFQSDLNKKSVYYK